MAERPNLSYPLQFLLFYKSKWILWLCDPVPNQLKLSGIAAMKQTILTNRSRWGVKHTPENARQPEPEVWKELSKFRREEQTGPVFRGKFWREVEGPVRWRNAMASASIAGLYGMGDDRPFMRITQSAMATSGQDP